MTGNEFTNLVDGDLCKLTEDGIIEIIKGLKR